jgi:AcrR family transcriptional regulator
MSPRASNRQALLEAAILCLQQRGYADTRARDITSTAGANLASIGYHFGSTEQLLAEALVEGFRRWFEEFALRIADDPSAALRERLIGAAKALRESVEQNRGLALAFVEALARAPRSSPLRQILADSYQSGRQAVATMLGTGADDTGEALASLLIATYDGLLIQTLLDPDRTPDDKQLSAAVQRLLAVAQPV